MQVDSSYKPLQVSLIMLWIPFSKPIISPSHPEDKNEVNLREVAHCSGFVDHYRSYVQEASLPLCVLGPL